jgi:hypothetical protein
MPEKFPVPRKNRKLCAKQGIMRQVFDYDGFSAASFAPQGLSEKCLLNDESGMRATGDQARSSA